MKNRIIALAIVLIAISAPIHGASSEETRAVFERMKELTGQWRSRSTKGWSEMVTFTLIGKGSALMEVSRFVDTPRDAMATMIHFDGERLLLTHYCEAGNQPRLVLSDVADGGRTATFSFLDATNLSSSRSGHMHSVRFHFIDPDHFSSQWTWFQGGKETWMEEIKSERVR
jgi:hypothetical protein